MKNVYASLFCLILSVSCLAQTINNPFDSRRNEFSQRDMISLFRPPSQPITQQILVYDWIEAFSQNDWSNIESRSGDEPIELSTATSGYMMIEAGNFNGDEKDDLLYLNELDGKWTYAALDQMEVLNETDSLYDFVLSDPEFIDGADIAGNHSYPTMAIGDFDGDGTDEAAVAWTEGSGWEIRIQLIDVSESGGVLSPTIQPVYFTGESSQRADLWDAISITAGDFNGDGTDELALSGIENNTSDPDVSYDAYVLIYDVSTDGAFTLLPQGKTVFDSTSLQEELDNEGAFISYVRTTVQAVRSYETDNIEGGQESVFVAVAHNYNPPSNNDYSYFHSYHLPVLADFDISNVEIGPVLTASQGGIFTGSPFESRRGEVSDDKTDDIVILTDRFIIFTFENGNLILGNNGTSGLSPNINETDDNYDECCDYFDLGDINRDGVMDIVVQTKSFGGGSGNQGHSLRVTAFETDLSNSNNPYTILQSGFMETFYPSGQSNNSSYAFAMGNLDGNDLCLGDPIVYDCEYHDPSIVLEAIPIHFDVFEDETIDVNGCFAFGQAGCGNSVSFTTSETSGESYSRQISSDWAVSGEVSAGFALGGFGMSGSLGYKYGEQFSSTEGSSSTFSITLSPTASSDDRIGHYVHPFTMLEYPVLNATSDTITWIIAAFPEGSVSDEPEMSSSKSLYNFLPNHEVGNILSYPKPDSDEMYYDKSEDENWMIFDGFNTLSIEPGGFDYINLAETINNSLEESSTTTQTLSASIGVTGMGLGATVSGEYTESEMEVFGESFTAAESYEIAPQQINSSGWSYEIKPVLYWTRDRATKLGMAVDMTSAGQNWNIYYGSQPDPALNLPYRNEIYYVNQPVAANLDRTKSMYFDKINPNPGDTVTAYLRVFNYSLMSMSQEVPFSLYVGHPDQGGQIIADLDGNTLHTNGEDLEDRGRNVTEISFVVTPSMFNSDTTKIYTVLDPNNEIDEIHEDNNIGWTPLGYACNPMGEVLSSGDVLIGTETYGYTIYPNPSRDFVIIDIGEAAMKLSGPVNVSVFDLTGKLVERQNSLNSTDGIIQLSVNHLPNGAYILQVSTNDHALLSSKLMVSR